MSCCINFTYEINGVATTVELNTAGQYQGVDYFTFDIGGTTPVYIWFQSTSPNNGQWLITELVGHLINTYGGTKETGASPCPPNGISGQGLWEVNDSAPFDGFLIAECVVDCPCLKLTIEADGNPQQEITVNQQYFFNGKPHYQFQYNQMPVFIWYDGSGAWVASTVLGDASTSIGRLVGNVECPIGEKGDQTGVNWGGVPPNIVTFTTEGVECLNPCPCVQFDYTERGATQPISVELSNPTGSWNGYSYWEVPHAGTNKSFYIFMYLDSDGCCQWRVYYDESNSTNPENGIRVATLGVANCVDDCNECPYGLYSIKSDSPDALPASRIEIIDCSQKECVYLEDRIFKEYNAIQFPIVFEEEDKGWLFSCCETFLVLADPLSTDSWKNDVNSAWCKLSDPTDSVAFTLYKDGVQTTYQPNPVPFVNEVDAFYATIFWRDVLQSEGIGCYTWKVEYNISGVISNFVWGVYHLKQYSISNANQTARVRVKFNLIQAIEGINFTDSNVEDSLRFNGFIGERQPNMEIDNLIYQDRVMKTVTRQNLNEYTITTDPAMEDITKKLVDLYLLSENEMFISDYNISNHSYRYNDLPVIVQNTPEINYIDLHQRKAIVTCVVGDRSKNKRTFF